jgi:hypothetical protein
MAVLRPTEDWEQRELVRGKSARRGFVAPGYTRAQQAIDAVVGNFGVRPGSSHPDDPSLLIPMGGISTHNIGGPTTWQVLINYESLTSSEAAAAEGQDVEPVMRKTIWTYEPGTASEVTDVDRHGQALLSSAGTPFRSGAPRTYTTLILEARRFYPAFDSAMATKYMNALNKAPIQMPYVGLCPARTVRVGIIKPTIGMTIGMRQPVEVLHLFEVRGVHISKVPNDPGFDAKFLDASPSGYYSSNDVIDAKSPGNFTLPTPEGTYEPATDEILLDGDGRPLDPAVKIGTTDPRDPVAITCNPKATRVMAPDKSACHLVYEIDREVELAPLLAGLK